MTDRIWIPGANGINQEIILEGGKAHSRLHNPHAATVMKINKGLRQTPGAVRSTSFGKLELDIPLDHFKMLDKFFPGLADPAHPDHKFALRAFMRSPVSAPYRLQEQKKGVNRGTHIQA